MSLDITLTEEEEEVYTSNVTSNVASMAQVAGFYTPLWNPKEIGITKAAQLYPLLQEGLSVMVLNPEKFEAIENYWGTYEQFVPWVFELIQACRRYPNAEISVC